MKICLFGDTVLATNLTPSQAEDALRKASTKRGFQRYSFYITTAFSNCGFWSLCCRFRSENKAFCKNPEKWVIDVIDKGEKKCHSE